MKVIGLIPACGKAERISPLPCSKEIFPVGLHDPETKKSFPKVMSDYLLSYFQEAEITNLYFIIQTGKQDIPKYFSRRKDLEMDIQFLELDHSPGTPFTLDAAYPMVRNHITALGFPDILMKPINAFKIAVDKLRSTEMDVVLGLFPIERKSSWDMVEVAGESVTKIVIKSPETTLDFGWTIAVWKPSFAAFMHHYLQGLLLPLTSELYVGHVFQAAIEQGMKIGHLLFPSGTCIDLGKPEDLAMIYREGWW